MWRCRIGAVMIRLGANRSVSDNKLSFAVRRGRTPFPQRSLGKCVVTYECTVDNSGEESGFVYVSRFRTVAQLQWSEIERAGASKQCSLFGSGSAGLGSCRRCARRDNMTAHRFDGKGSVNSFAVNGRNVCADKAPNTPLSWVLRDGRRLGVVESVVGLGFDERVRLTGVPPLMGQACS